MRSVLATLRWLASVTRNRLQTQLAYHLPISQRNGLHTSYLGQGWIIHPLTLQSIDRNWLMSIEILKLKNSHFGTKIAPKSKRDATFPPINDVIDKMK
jgi:hypothetical protein